MTAGVYLIRGENALIKIGCSSNVERRAALFQTGSPEALTIVHVIETEQYKQVERALHHRFAAQRRRGEWFELSEDDVITAKAYAVPGVGAEPVDAALTPEAQKAAWRLGRAIGNACRQVDSYEARGDTAQAERWQLIVERLFEAAMAGSGDTVD
jgi:predicted GIY-YIG superfamily endonuclease